MAPTPIGSVQGIEALIAFGLQVFSQIFSLFSHPTNPLPVSAVPHITQAINATPGLTDQHKAVAAAFTQAAVEVHQASKQ